MAAVGTKQENVLLLRECALALSKSTVYSKGVEAAVSSLGASTLKLKAIKDKALETRIDLMQGSNTLSDSERQELIERLFRLQQDLEVETGAGKTAMEVVNISMKGALKRLCTQTLRFEQLIK